VQQFLTRWAVPIVVLLLLLPVSIAANDPGHDSLYVLKIGDSNVTGTINISANITATIVQATSRFFGPNIDIRGDGTSSAATNQLIGTNSHLELSSTGELILNKAVTGGWVYIGWPGTTTGLNVTGQIIQQGVNVCLSNGTNCPATLSSSNVSGTGTTGTLAKWTGASTLGDSILVESGSTLLVSGSINLTQNATASYLRATNLVYGDALDIRTNGTIQSVTSRPALQGGTNALYLDSTGTLYLNTKGGTTNTVQVGDGATNAITLNVSGTIKQQNIAVCLANGTNCPASFSGANLTGSGSANYLSKWTSGTNLGTSVLSDDGTNIGIGTATPVQKLDVIGTVNATSFTGAGTGLTGTAAGLTVGTASYLANTSYLNATGFNAANITSGTLAVARGGTGVATSTGSDSVVLNNSPIITGTGTLVASTIKVGTNNVCQSDGTNCPGTAAGASSGWINTSGSGNISLASNSVNVSANALFIDNTNQRIGVRTATPAGVLEVNGTSSTTSVRITTNSNATTLTSDSPSLELVNTNVSLNQSWGTNNYVRIDFSAKNSTGSVKTMASVVGIAKNHTNETTGSNGQLAFLTTGSGTLAERMRIDESGNVGIGTTTPNQKLSVAGNLSSTTDAVFATTSGNVGIGTGAPATKLSIALSTDDGISISQATAFKQAYLYFLDQGAGKWYIGKQTDNSFFINDVANSADRLRLDTTGNVLLQPTSGNVGIGTTTPGQLLDVRGTMIVNSSAAGSFQVINGSSTPNIYVTGTNGYVGIGTAVPTAQLHITQQLRIDGTDANGYRAIGFGGTSNTANPNIYTNGNYLAINVKNGANTLYLNHDSGSTSQTVLQDGGGKVGIGTATPDASFAVTINGNSAGVGPGILLTDAAASPENYALYINGNKKFTIRDQTATTDRLTIDTSGNIGIATTNPSSPSGYAPILAVAGTAPVFVLNETDTGKVSEIGLNGGVLAFTTAGGIAPLKIDSASAVDSTLYLKAGSVGIGTAGPATTVDASGTVRSTSQTVPTSGAGTEMEYVSASNTGTIRAYDRSGAAYKALSLNDNVFSTGGSGSNVGIGTTSPVRTLNVVGTGNFTSTLFAGSCAGSGCTDIAELYPSKPEVTPGDVVCRGVDGNATPCTDGLPLLGVVSTHPAIIIDGDHVVLGASDNASSASRPIALKGRVPIKVQCPITTGDYLIPSSTPGHAAAMNLSTATVADSLRVIGTSIEGCTSGNTTLMVWLR
jgi:hypothetical protein